MIIVRSAKSTFIQSECQLDWQGGANAVQACCTFDRSAYDDRLFDHWDITFPEVLDRAVIKRRAEFLAGRYCAQKALTQLGVVSSAVGIGKSRSPMWPTGVKGSISHSGHSAIAVVSLDSHILGLGVDIEDYVEEDMIEQASRYVLQRDEMNFLQQRTMAAVQMFTLIFSIKESFFKAAFPLVNAYFDFDAVTVLELDSEAQEVLFRLNYSLHEQLQKGMQFTGKYCPLNALSSGQGSLASFVAIANY